MAETYARHAEICAKFYELTIDGPTVADFISSKIRAVSGQKALFVGGMFNVAKGLKPIGLELTVVDYTDEMVRIGGHHLLSERVLKADLRTLPFESEFDLVFVIGRVFTHMTTEDDLFLAIQSCYRALKPRGKLLADNYEVNRICVTNYFNGEVNCNSDLTQICRQSTTTQISRSPFIVKWDARYFGTHDGKEFSFSDSMNHRAFSREEFSDALRLGGFNVLEQGDNFDETSFFTLAERKWGPKEMGADIGGRETERKALRRKVKK